MDRRLIALVAVVFSLASFAVWRGSGQVGPGQEHDYGKLTDWVLIGFNGLLAVFTLLLWISTDKLWKAGERQIGVAMKAASAAERSAALAEAALLGAEAPFIYATAEGWRKGDPLAPGNRPGFGAFTLHNHGRSPAIVREVYASPLRSRYLPQGIPFPPMQSALHKVQIIPPGSSNEPHRFTDAAFTRDADAKTDNEGVHWIVGQVRYTDPFGVQYLTGFCFAYNAFSHRFYLQGGSDLNYRRRLSEEETREAEKRDAELPPHLSTADA
ncbi:MULTISPECIES: hypothetical protein [unclassified Methylobacterium]|uniref:hypothetical protein n=1 Tax=unclassified Methylobacterium TaxID=2615210 RepID=UPI00226A91CC|nr:MULTISPECIES: hypothetical protein [unclassified Methylobacterium]